MKIIILVDDEPDLLFTTELILERDGFQQIHSINDSRELLPYLEQHAEQVGLIVLDLIMPHLSGKELLSRVIQKHPGLPVIIMTASNDIETAIGCMRSGARDYLLKPVDETRLLASIRDQMEIVRLRDQVHSLEQALSSKRLRNPDAFAHLVISSDTMLHAMQRLEAVADSREPVLILGESGVGKGLVVTALHHLGDRSTPLVSVNVAGLDDTMFSDTLFGHVKGAFSGADSHRSGLVAKAGRGILFLDEIGELSLASQVKLLQLIQERTYLPLGSDNEHPCRARIVCATHVRLQERVQTGAFRADLYYRLRVHQIPIPPLRERREELPEMISHFLHQAAQELNKRTPTPPPELITLLTNHPFPGNLRELRAMCYDAVAHHEKGLLSMAVFKQALDVNHVPSPVSTETIRDKLIIPGPLPTLKEAEDFLLDEALQRAAGNQGIAASMLGISRRALNGRLARQKDQS